MPTPMPLDSVIAGLNTTGLMPAMPTFSIGTDQESAASAIGSIGDLASDAAGGGGTPFGSIWSILRYRRSGRR